MEIEIGDLRASSVDFTATEPVVALADSRKIVTPLAWYPRLQQAACTRANYGIMPMGMHWPDFDEGLSIAGMLKGGSKAHTLKRIQREPFGSESKCRRIRNVGYF